ncbi:MAG: Gfo/Idh/MocA family oxidoreductase [Anaerolineaceae bacterium]|nr:Gfo/Idh/MocA family oxidoreductase [Anaerolineaceae bacterium]
MKRNWGILATGNICNQMAQALTDAEEANILAAASRTQGKADVFTKRWNIPRSYGSYEVLVNDPDVEIIYIGSPHGLHYDHIKLCLNHGKHVLCEKAFTINAKQAEECIALAKEKSLFLMEGMWTRFFPLMVRLRELLKEDVLGKISLVQADFCIQRPFDPEHRLFKMELGGGALLDLGIYVLSFASMVLGQSDQIIGDAVFGPAGSDELDTITTIYPDGVRGQFSCAIQIHRPHEAFIVGEKGYIKVHEGFYKPDKMTLHLNGQAAEIIKLPARSNGLIHEVEEVHNCLDQGRIESEIMPLHETVELMSTMDDLRNQWGLKYPME